MENFGSEGGPAPAWVRLRVRDGAAVTTFYTDVVGLGRLDGSTEREVRLGAPGQDDATLILEVDPSAPPAGGPAPGLYHLAYRLPSREDLARMYRHLRFAGVDFRGAADHGVSEALYFSDPAGNGVEVYADRPAESWVWEDGEVRMGTDALDGNGLLATADGESSLPPGSRLGHVHLRTADLDAAEEFWTGEVGLEVTTRSWQGALFLAFERYHHHLGLNSWGAPLERRPEGSAGLVETGWKVPGLSAERTLEDPDGHRVVLVPA